MSTTFPGTRFGTEDTGRIRRSQSLRNFQRKKTDINKWIVIISAIKEEKKKEEKEEERRGRRWAEGRRGGGRGGKKKTAEKTVGVYYSKINLEFLTKRMRK